MIGMCKQCRHRDCPERRVASWLLLDPFDQKRDAGLDLVLYGQRVRIERHWWNGNPSLLGRRDVYIRTDGQRWEVMAQTGGNTGRSKVHACPGRASAEILADAWRGGRPEWRELGSGREPQQHSRQRC
jgi:hypothetical protein